MRLAIFFCLPFLLYITLVIISHSVKPVYDLVPINTNHTSTTTGSGINNTHTFTSRPKISPHVAPLAALAMTLVIALIMALQTHQNPELFFGMLIQSGVFINLFVFRPGTSSEFQVL